MCGCSLLERRQERRRKDVESTRMLPPNEHPPPPFARAHTLCHACPHARCGCKMRRDVHVPVQPGGGVTELRRPLALRAPGISSSPFSLGHLGSIGRGQPPSFPLCPRHQRLARRLGLVSFAPPAVRLLFALRSALAWVLAGAVVAERLWCGAAVVAQGLWSLVVSCTRALVGCATLVVSCTSLMSRQTQESKGQTALRGALRRRQPL